MTFAPVAHLTKERRQQFALVALCKKNDESDSHFEGANRTGSQKQAVQYLAKYFVLVEAKKCQKMFTFKGEKLSF